jgi:PAS domain S-box-containing protein
VSENASEWIWEMDKNGLYTFASPIVKEILGYEPEEIVNKKYFYDFFIPKDRELMKQAALEIFSRKENIKNLINNNLHKDGREIILSTSGVPIIDSNGNLTGYRGVDIDITEQKRAEEALKKSESKYRNLIETMPEGFYRSTPEGYFVDVNPALVKMLGYDSKEELMKIHIPEDLYFSEEERTKVTNYNIDFIPDTEIYRLRRKDGSEIWIEDHARYISDSSGKILFHEGIMRDITESLSAKNAIIEAKERAEEANRLKTSFLANMSHELRTPMVGILGFSEILKQECETQDTRAMAENILTSGNRLMDTLNLILDISRIEAGKLSLNYDYVDIIKVAKDVINTFDIQAKKVYLELKFESKEKSIVCRIDERLVRQIISNLVNNAIKYTEKGGVSVEISKEISDGRYYSIIKVKDTGLGIPKKFQKVIFEEFRQVSEGYGRSFEGTGLGLSIVEKFVKRLGGEISVESNLGSGSIFTVRFPVDPDEFSPKITNIIEKPKTDIEEEKIIPEERIKALCVDDDEGTLSIAREFLKEILDLELVYNGTDAINLAKKKEYSLILMDINLKSEIDGVETTEIIRKIKGYEKIPVIAVTAFAMKGDREKYLNLGFDYYLAKPFKRDEIISVVKKAMKSISN